VSSPAENLRRRWTLRLLLMLSVLPSAAAASPRIEAQLTCPAESSRGRVLCELRIASPGGRLVWSDALVTGAPGFTKPLRARVGASQSRARSEREAALPIALVALEAGSGSLEVAARAVVCTTAEAACVPIWKPVRARLVVR
jgi:hypothetical protein